MKKVLSILIIIYCAFTILHYVKGDDFNFYNYVSSLDSLNDLEKPIFKKIELPSLDEFGSESISYYLAYDYICDFDGTNIDPSNNRLLDFYDCYYCPHFSHCEEIIIGGRSVYNSSGSTSHENLSYTDYKKAQISIEVYNSLQCEEAKSCFYAVYEENEIDIVESIQLFFNYLVTPIKFLWYLLTFIFDTFIYLFNVLMILGGGLLV